jgi:hypothetical protein
MDLENAVAAPIVRKVGGKQYSFPRLTMRDLGGLLAELREEKRQSLLKNAEDAGVKPDSLLTKLQELDDRQFDTFEGIRWSRTPDGAARTVEASLSKSDKPTPIDDLPIGNLDLSLLACELWGLAPRQTPNAEAGDDADGPLATTKNENPRTTP